MKEWFKYYWKESLGAFVALLGLAIISVWSGRESVRISPEIMTQARMLCQYAGVGLGLDLDANDGQAITIGPRTKNAGWKGIMFTWSQKNLSVKCNVYREKIMFFAVNGEDLTGKVKREERN